MSDEPPESNALVEFTDLFGIGKLSEAVFAAIQATVSRVYRPVAIRKEGSVLIDLHSKALIDTAKARVEAKAILQQGDRDALAKVRAIEDLAALDRLERQADAIGAGAKRASEKQAAGSGVRETSFEWMDLFLEMAERIDDTEIKSIWAEILAREVTEGQRRISLHTLDSMRYLERRHARLFDAYARTFLVFGQCWRDGFDAGGGDTAKSLLGQSDAFNDFRALAEMGFVQIEPGDTPTKGNSRALNFHRFGVRITPSHTTLNIQTVRPTMRGEELMRVVLGLGGESEDLSVGRFAKNSQLAYQVLDPERQAMVLRRWFQYLRKDAFRVEVGIFAPGQAFLNCEYQLVWEEGGLIEAKKLADLNIPPEIAQLLG